MKKIIVLILGCIALAACSTEDAPTQSTAATNDSELTGNNGRVLSVVQVPGYTYIEVRNSGRSLWLAGNPVDVAKGDIVSWGQSALMRNFESNALGRTFDEILFVAAVYPGLNGAATPPPATANNIGLVQSTMDSAGYTYADVLTDTGTRVWVAGPTTSLSPGDRVTWQDASVMKDFTSNSLGQTFPEIFFVSAIQGSE